MTARRIRKPFFKRWTFYALILFIIVMVIVRCSNFTYDTDDTENKESGIKNETEVERETGDSFVSLYPQEILEDDRFKESIKSSAKYFIEELEKQKVEDITEKTLAIYSEYPVKDKSGLEFPYSFVFSGRYEEAGTGALKDFIMTLGFTDDGSLEFGAAYCIQYINDDTNYSLNDMDPEDDDIIKIIETINE